MGKKNTEEASHPWGFIKQQALIVGVSKGYGRQNEIKRG